MKSKSKEITSILLVFVLIVLSTAVLYGCGDDDNNFETEYLRYHIYYGKAYEVVFIDGLTENGTKLKNIVIPLEIDGIPVTKYTGIATAPNLRKIIVSYNMTRINSFGGIAPGSMFVNDWPDDLKVLYVSCEYRRGMIMEPDFYIATEALESYQKNIPNPTVYTFANMQYMYNYDEAPNKGVFFIDDLDVGETLEVIPETPKREGYTFVGWYAEAECVNGISLDGYVKDDEEIVYLYAGWRENK